MNNPLTENEKEKATEKQIAKEVARLKDGNYLVRCDAVCALAQIGGFEAVPAFAEALNDSGSFVRNAALHALEHIGDGAVDALVGALRNRDSFVRSAAAAALGKIGNAAAIPALIQLFRDRDRSVRFQASTALGQIGMAAVPALIAMLDELKSDDVQYCSISALWSIGDCFTLPRKILAASYWPAQRRIDLLDSLRYARYEQPNMTMHYDFPDTEEFCLAVLDEGEGDARRGAQTILRWLEGDRDLLIASDSSNREAPQELLRSAQNASHTIQPETLLRGADNSSEKLAHKPNRRAVRMRLFGKRDVDR